MCSTHCAHPCAHSYLYTVFGSYYDPDENRDYSSNIIGRIRIQFISMGRIGVRLINYYCTEFFPAGILSGCRIFMRVIHYVTNSHLVSLCGLISNEFQISTVYFCACFYMPGSTRKRISTKKLPLSRY